MRLFACATARARGASWSDGWIRGRSGRSRRAAADAGADPGSRRPMPSTNFDLAPPAKAVDGLLAVPIDIQQIAASLRFDGATSSGSGDATVDFVVGPTGG